MTSWDDFPLVRSARRFFDPDERDRFIRTMLTEAGAEPDEGIAAVGHTILNRLDSGKFGAKLGDLLTPTQFNGLARPEARNPDLPNTPGYQKVAAIADKVLTGDVPDPTGGATHFYSPANMPDGKEPWWAPKMAPLGEIGGHRFFREDRGQQVAQTESRAPSWDDFPLVQPAPSAPPPPVDFSKLTKIPTEEAKPAVNRLYGKGASEDDIAEAAWTDFNRRNKIDVPYADVKKKYSPGEILEMTTGLVNPQGAAYPYFQGAARGFADAAPVLGGGFAGAKIGMTLGAPFGPVGIGAGGLVGLGVGAGAGLLAGNEIKKGFKEKKDFVPSARPPFAAGEDLGAGLGAAAIPIAAGASLTGSAAAFAPKGAQWLTRLIEHTLKSASSAPLSFLGREVVFSTVAGLGGGIAESSAPDNPGARLVGNIVAPIGTTLFTSGARSVLSNLGSFGPSGRTAVAEKQIAKKLQEAGEDPEAVASVLDEWAALVSRPGYQGLGESTVAQITGSPYLSRLENSLVKMSAQFGEDRAAMAAKNLTASRVLVNHMFEAGARIEDPNARRAAFQAAAEVAAKRFELLLDTRLATIQQGSAEAARRVFPDIDQFVNRMDELPGHRASVFENLSRKADAATLDSIRDGRALERNLWDAIPDGPRPVTNTLSTADAVLADRMQVGAQMSFGSASIDQSIEHLRTNGVSSVDELIKFRKLLNDEIPSLDKAGVPRSKLSDLVEIKEAVEADIGAVAVPEFFVATAYSKAFNDTYRRALMGDMIASNSRQMDWMPPELLLESGLTGNMIIRGLKYKELRQAADFPRTQAEDSTVLAQGGFYRPDPSVGQAMEEAQTDYLRTLATKTMTQTPEGNIVVDPKKLQTILEQDAAVLNQMPALQKELLGAGRATTLVQQTAEQMAARKDRLLDPKVTTFAQMAGLDDPIEAIDLAVKSARPVKSLVNLFHTAKRGGPDAVDGARQTLLDWAARRAGESDDYLIGLGKALDSSIGGIPGRGSVLDLAVKNGILPPQEAAGIRQMLKIASRIGTSVNEKGTMSLGEAGGFLSYFEDFIVRVHGSSFGQALSPGGTHPLQAGGFGAKLFSKLNEQYVRRSVPHLMLQLARDPQAMALALRRVSGPQRSQIKTTLDAYLSAVLPQGLLSDEDSSQ